MAEITNIKTVVFWRKPREKRITLKDGSERTHSVKGSWAYRLSYNEDGMPKTEEKAGFDRKGKASDALDARKKVLEGPKVISKDVKDLTFEGLVAKSADKVFPEAEFIINAAGERENINDGYKSWRTLQSQLRHLAAFFGKVKIEEIEPALLVKYKAHRRKQYRQGTTRHITLATVNRELSAMRSLMKFAWEEGWVSKDVFARANAKTKKKKLIDIKKEVERKQTASPEEEARLLAACVGEFETVYDRVSYGKRQEVTVTGERNDKRLRALIILAVETAMRKGELLAMKWKEIDFERGVIYIPAERTKNGSERYTTLSKRAAIELEAMRMESDGERVFSITDFKKSWATTKRIAGVEDLRFHDLRATAITRWALKGVPIQLAAAMAGHKNPEITQRIYTRAGVDVVAEVTKQIERANATDSWPEVIV
jgi:integrase